VQYRFALKTEDWRAKKQKGKNMNQYDAKYAGTEYYWGKKPSPICYKVLEMNQMEKQLSLFDIGCGEGRNAVFFARNGYNVTALDLSVNGVNKTKAYAELIGITINVFEASLLDYRIDKNYDVLFSSGVLQYIPEEKRKTIIENYQKNTAEDGLNVFSVFVKKPFIEKSPGAEKTAYPWYSGELLAFYKDWKIEYSCEEIFDCMSSGIPHKHAVNRVIARKT